MHHDMLQGTHYTAGFRWGALLREHGRILLREIPFAVTEERVDYARACLLVYQTYYPEVLEEIAAFVPTLGWQCAGLDFSPIRGPEGNIEFLLYIVPADAGAQPLHEYAISDTIRRAYDKFIKMSE